jgi:hypothetical protein
VGLRYAKKGSTIAEALEIISHDNSLNKITGKGTFDCLFRMYATRLTAARWVPVSRCRGFTGSGSSIDSGDLKGRKSAITY